MNCLWRIELFGGMQLVRADGATTRFSTRKVAALLAYLSYFSDRPHSREVLAEMLWPDTEFDAQRNSFRVALNSLRRQLEPPGIAMGAVLQADRSQLRLHPDAFETDVMLFAASLRDAARAEDARARCDALARAVALYRGPLLTGWYEDWIDAERSRHADACARAYQELTALLWERDDREAAIDAARCAVKADPLEEESHRRLILLLARAGRPEHARQQYDALETILQDELGRRPSPLTRDLLHNLPPADAPPTARRLPDVAPPADIPARAEPSRGYLPRPLTRFFGRDDALALLTRLLAPDGETRLVTLLGPGGAGKTRAALEAGQRLENTYAGRVWFVSLAAVTDAEQLPHALAAALRCTVGPDADPTALVLDALAGAPTLLLLDNAETLATAVADTVTDLLLALPQLHCLVTSRIALDCADERLVPLPPLPAPADASPETLLACPSVALFLDRAQAVRPDFQVTVRNAAAVARLCRCLDGWPLALELVAAWAWILTPVQMVERLNAGDETRGALLTTERHGVPERQRSLRTILDSTFQLLRPDQCDVLTRLSVFRGGFTLEAAQAVAGSDALETLDALRRQALVSAVESDQDVRFSLLEIVREYAASRLDPTGRREAQTAHLRHFAERAAQVRREIDGPRGEEALHRFDRERENLIAALCSGIELGDGETTLATAAALWPIWYAQGCTAESVALLERALAAAPADSPHRGEALLGLGRLLAARGLVLDAQRAFLASLQDFRRHGRDACVPAVAINLALAARDTADFPAAIEALETYAQTVGDDPWAILWAQREIAQMNGQPLEDDGEGSIGEVFLRLGVVAGERGDLSAGRSLLDEARHAAQASGDASLEALAYNRLALLAQRQGDVAAAQRFRDDALVASRTSLREAAA